MRTLYLECNTGVSSEMLLGALADLLKDPSELKRMIEGLGVPGIVCNVDVDDESLISGIRVSIACNDIKGWHATTEERCEHHSIRDVLDAIGSLNVSDRVKDDTIAIYSILAEAESNVHRKPVNEVHFHEVGALDNIVNVVGCCMLIEKLSPASIIVSPIRTGYGEIVCSHGTLPVPAPATAYILKGMPIYAGDAEGEFTTPTGAAIVKHFAKSHGQLPLMDFDDVGYGLGRRMKIAMVRAYVGDVKDGPRTVKKLTCNINNMNPEDANNILGILMRDGALDAFIENCITKNGVGFKLTAICHEGNEKNLAVSILTHTSAISIETHICERYERSSFKTCRSDFGTSES